MECPPKNLNQRPHQMKLKFKNMNIKIMKQLLIHSFIYLFIQLFIYRLIKRDWRILIYGSTFYYNPYQY